MRSTCTALLLVYLGATPAVGATTQTLEPRSAGPAQITLSEAVAQALARNRDLAVSRSELDISRGRLRQAGRYPFNPELAVEGDAGQAKDRAGDAGRRAIGGGRIGLSQVVEVRGQRGLRVQRAEAELARTEWAVRDAEREVIAETTRAFSELLVAQERRELAREVVRILTGLKTTAEGLVQAGAVPEIDVLRADVELRRAANRVALAEAGVAAAGRALAVLVGAPASVPLGATGPLLFEPIPGTLEELLATARANRPDLKAAQAAAEAAQAALRLVRAERLVPFITLSAAYGGAAEFDSTNHRALFGISVPLPLWNRREGDVDAAAGEVAKLQAQWDHIRARIEKEVATTFQQFAATTRVVEEFVRRIVPAQEENAKLIQEGYRLGEFRLTEALLAQRDLIETRTAYLEAIAAYNVARADLQKAIGVRP